MRDHMKSRTGGGKVVIGLVGLVALFSLVTLCPISAYAHPPKEVALAYDLTTTKLTVTVIHEVSFPSWHYIKKIEIKKNGISIGVHSYESQPTESKFSYTYDVPAANGDVIEVTATCNISGSKTEKLTVK